MAKKCPKCECPAGEKWAVPFADFLSLLLALFIALYALASVNKEKQKALKEEFMKIYSFNAESDTMKEPEETEKSKTNDPKDADVLGKQSDANESIAKLDKMEEEIKNGGTLLVKDQGTYMELPAHVVFETGRAELSAKNAPSFVSRLAKIISTMPEDTLINVKGYADDTEIKNSKYQDALELSTARANNVVRELVKNKIPLSRIYSSGFGSTNAGQSDKKVVDFELKSSKDLKKDEEMDIESIMKKVE